MSVNLMQAYCFRFYFLLVTVIIFVKMVRDHTKEVKIVSKRKENGSETQADRQHRGGEETTRESKVREVCVTHRGGQR